MSNNGEGNCKVWLKRCVNRTKGYGNLSLPPTFLPGICIHRNPSQDAGDIHTFVLFPPPPVTTIKLRSWIIEPKYNSALEVSFQCTSLNDTLALSVR